MLIITHGAVTNDVGDRRDVIIIINQMYIFWKYRKINLTNPLVEV